MISLQLVLDKITKQFNEKQVLQGVEQRFEKGKIYGLLGRNGAGKTTLFVVQLPERRAEDGWRPGLIGG
ncbi:ATP-binding cassette domain-containing protein [Paenibacillus sambharensis]|uniref:ATP-binding cassette domain-containing protein n=1 Tax=Paenibacillus sambharensis TaxID=1803190 RepID=UPI002482ADE3|nr:ATP-binding cassette domain-containing protein [Paenibacillus sambharensis]